MFAKLALMGPRQALILGTTHSFGVIHS